MKAPGREIKVNTKEGELTEFVIQLTIHQPLSGLTKKSPKGREGIINFIHNDLEKKLKSKPF